MLTIHISKHTAKYLLTILLAASLSACNTYANPVKTGKKNMSELTKTMRPVCVGRFVLEIPTDTNIKNWQHEADYIKIESISFPSLNQNAFNAKVQQLETKLKLSPHKTENVRFKTKTQLSTESVLFVYREDAKDITGYNLDALFWKSGVEYQFSTSSTNEDLPELTGDISKVTKSFIAMPTQDFMSWPSGFCLEQGVVTLINSRFENISITGRIKDYPGVELKFSTQSTNGSFNGKTLIERIDNSFGMGDAMAITMTKSTKFLRKGKRTLNGQKGEEVVAFFDIDGKKTMDADAEFYGEPNVLEKPYIRISLRYDPENTEFGQTTGKAISEKDFVTLWDALLSGLKPRTAGLWGNASHSK